MDPWQTLGTILLTSVFSGGMFAALAKSFFDVRLAKAQQEYRLEADKQLATFNTEQARILEDIKGTNAVNLEQLKNALQSGAFAQEIRFSRIYDRQITALVDLFQKAVAAEQAARQYVARMESGQSHPELSMGALGAFIQHAEENAIWLPEVLVPLVTQLAEEVTRSTIVPAFTNRQPAETAEELLARIGCEQVAEIRGRLGIEIRALLPTLDPTAANDRLV